MRLSSVGVDRVHSEWAAVPVLGLGDLGGWALDLLQIRGSYLANAPEEDLASWLYAHLGEQDARMGFGYSDVLADCDAWLLARSMQSNSFERSLSTAMRDMFAQSETNRIKRFYQSRFKGSADNLVIAFRKLVDGIDLGIFDNVSGSKKHCSLRHMQTDSRVKRRLVYWHYPMLNLLKIRTVNQSWL